MDHRDADQVREVILRVRKDLGVGRHDPGRLRVRFSPTVVVRAPEFGSESFQGLIRSIDGIEGLDLRLMAQSLVITYDPAVIPPATWDTVINGDDADAEAALTAILKA